MSSTFLSLCQTFQRVTGITGSEISSVVNQTGINRKIVQFVADADINIQNLWQDWKFLEGSAVITTVNGTDEYSLATLGITDHISWDAKRFYINPGTNNYNNLTPMPYREWLDSSERLGVKSSGEPDRIVVKADSSLVLIDKPDAAYTIWGRYFITPTRMSANADTSAIPTSYDMSIVYRAKMFYGEYYENWDLYKSAKEDFDAELVKLESTQLPDQETRTRASNEDNAIEVA